MLYPRYVSVNGNIRSKEFGQRDTSAQPSYTLYFALFQIMASRI